MRYRAANQTHLAARVLQTSLASCTHVRTLLRLPQPVMDQDIVFDFEHDIQEEGRSDAARQPVLPVGEIGQQPKNFVKNFKKVRSHSTGGNALLVHCSRQGQTAYMCFCMPRVGLVLQMHLRLAASSQATLVMTAGFCCNLQRQGQ
jgi:hypothetical protein